MYFVVLKPPFGVGGGGGSIPTPPLAREVNFRKPCNGFVDTAVGTTAEIEF